MMLLWLFVAVAVIGFRMGIAFGHKWAVQAAQKTAMRLAREGVAEHAEELLEHQRAQLEVTIFGEVGDPPRLWEDLLMVVQLHARSYREAQDVDG